MAHYFVDNRPQADGSHAVHAKGCNHMASDKQYLGEYFSLLHAIMEARKSLLGHLRLHPLRPRLDQRVPADEFPYPRRRLSKLL